MRTDIHKPRMYDTILISKSSKYALVKQYYDNSATEQFKIAEKQGTSYNTKGFLPLGDKANAIKHFNKYWRKK